MKNGTKVLIPILIAFILLCSSIPLADITYKYGTDGGGDSWFGPINTITNSNGRCWESNASNLQLAVTNLSSTGGTVWVPSGTFDMDPALAMESNVILIGMGNSTVIGRGDVSVDSNVIEIDGKQNVQIYNLQVNGYKLTSDGAACEGIEIDNSQHVTIRDVFINATNGTGISANSTSNYIIIDGCWFENIAGARGNMPYTLAYGGIYMGCPSVVVTNCFFIDVWSQGICCEGGAAHQAYDWSITNNIVTGETGRGIYVEGAYYGANCTISNNIIHDLHGENWIPGYGGRVNIGIVADCSIVDSNIIRNVPGIGILSEYGCIISNNKIINTKNASRGQEGIQVYKGKAVIEGNIINGTQEEGILVTSTAGNVTIFNNEISNTLKSAISTVAFASAAHVADGRLSISMNTLNNVGEYGIVVTRDWCIVSGNSIYNSDYAGIKFTSVENCTANSNVIYKPSANHGISLENCINMTITSNRCSDCVSGIVESGTCDYNIYIGNNCMGNTNGIVESGTHNIPVTIADMNLV